MSKKVKIFNLIAAAFTVLIPILFFTLPMFENIYFVKNADGVFEETVEKFSIAQLIPTVFGDKFVLTALFVVVFAAMFGIILISLIIKIIIACFKFKSIEYKDSDMKSSKQRGKMLLPIAHYSPIFGGMIALIAMDKIPFIGSFILDFTTLTYVFFIFSIAVLILDIVERKVFRKGLIHDEK